MKNSNTTTPDRNAIAKRAYELYLARGRKDGHAHADWLRAEAEIKASGTKSSTTTMTTTTSRPAAKTVIKTSATMARPSGSTRGSTTTSSARNTR